jgi:hypothetical protein
LIDPVLGELGSAPVSLSGSIVIEDDGLNIRVASDFGRHTVIRASTPTRLGNQFGLLGAPVFSATNYTSYSAIGADAWPAPWLLPRSTARLINLSTRGIVGTGEQSLFAGVVLESTTQRPLLVRGIGPELRKFGVADAALNPTLSIFSGNTLLARNSGWDLAPNASVIAASAINVGAFPLSIGAKDTAYLESYIGGAYTFQIAGSGSGLVEVYDVAPSALNTRLANLSTRALIPSRETPLIAGFVLGGTGTRTLLIRAIGPGLSDFGVATPISDPKITLYDGSGKIVYDNDDWGALASISPLAATAKSVGAFPLSREKDAALFVRLPAGAYSVHVTNNDGRPGIALVEIYDIIE